MKGITKLMCTLLVSAAANAEPVQANVPGQPGTDQPLILEAPHYVHAGHTVLEAVHEARGAAAFFRSEQSLRSVFKGPYSGAGARALKLSGLSDLGGWALATVGAVDSAVDVIHYSRSIPVLKNMAQEESKRTLDYLEASGRQVQLKNGVRMSARDAAAYYRDFLAQIDTLTPNDLDRAWMIARNYLPLVPLVESKAAEHFRTQEFLYEWVLKEMEQLAGQLAANVREIDKQREYAALKNELSNASCVIKFACAVDDFVGPSSPGAPPAPARDFSVARAETVVIPMNLLANGEDPINTYRDILQMQQLGGIDRGSPGCLKMTGGMSIALIRQRAQEAAPNVPAPLQHFVDLANRCAGPRQVVNLNGPRQTDPTALYIYGSDYRVFHFGPTQKLGEPIVSPLVAFERRWGFRPSPNPNQTYIGPTRGAGGRDH